MPRLNRPRLHLLGLGAATLALWWQMRLLGDPRLEFPTFLVFFGSLFGLYLAVLGRIQKAEQLTPPLSQQFPLLLPTLLLLGLTARVFLVGMPPAFSDDLYRYDWDAQVQAEGIDPYRYAPNDPALAHLQGAEDSKVNFPSLRTVYPPLMEGAFRVGRWLHPSVLGQKLFFTLSELLTLLALLWILRIRKRSLFWSLAYWWHPLVIIEVAGSGHNDALGAAFLWLGVAAWVSRKQLGAAAFWAASFLSKFFSAILFPWWLFRRQGRGALLLCLVGCVVPMLLHWNLVTALLESLGAEAVSRVSSNASVYALLVFLTGSAKFTPWVVLAAWGGFLLWWGKREEDPIRFLVGGFAFAVFFTPALHPWYLIWMIPGFCFWRVPFLMALTGTVIFTYSVWPGYLQTGLWQLPTWAWGAEYLPVGALALWGWVRSRKNPSVPKA